MDLYLIAPFPNMNRFNSEPMIPKKSILDLRPSSSGSSCTIIWSSHSSPKVQTSHWYQDTITPSHHALNTPGARHCARHCKSTRSALRGVYCRLHFTRREHAPRIKWLDSLEAIWLFVAELGLQPKSLVIFFFLKLSWFFQVDKELFLILIYFSIFLISLLIYIFLYHWEMLTSPAGGPSFFCTLTMRHVCPELPTSPLWGPALRGLERGSVL